MTDAVLNRVAQRLFKCPFDPELFDSKLELEMHLFECHADRICEKRRVLRQDADEDAERPVSLTICKYCEDEGGYFAIPRYRDRAPDEDMHAHIRQKHRSASGSVRVPFLEPDITEAIAKFMEWRRWKDEFVCCFGQCSERYDDPIHVLEHWMNAHLEPPTSEDVKHALESDLEGFQERFPELLAAAMEEERDRTQPRLQTPDDGYRIHHMPPVPRVRSRPGEFIIYIERTLSRIREDEYEDWMAAEGLDDDEMTGGDLAEASRQPAFVELRFCNIVDGYIPLVREVRRVLAPFRDGDVVEMSWQDDPEAYFPCKVSGSRSKRAIYNLNGRLKGMFGLHAGVRLYITSVGQRRYQLSARRRQSDVLNCKEFVSDGAGGWRIEFHRKTVQWETGEDVFRHQITFEEMDALHAEARRTNLSVRDAVHQVMERYALTEAWSVRRVWDAVFAFRTCSLASVWAQFRAEHTCYVRDETNRRYKFDPNGEFPEIRVLAPRARNERVIVEQVGVARAPAKRLCIVVHWSKIFGDWCPDQRFAGTNGGKNQARFIGSLISQFPHLAERLKVMPVSRTRPLSDDPMRDFVIQSTHEVFNHQPVPGTHLYLFTNTDNDERREDILNLVKRLGFEGSIEVTVTPGMSRIDWLNSLL
ncbi:MAG: hypothetical protein ABIP85_14605 [Chthoniobacteraceae bacterium]